MLNERERRILDAIELGLSQDDPDLRHRLDAAPRRHWMRSWPFVAAALGVVVAVGLVFLGLVGHAVLVVAIATGPLVLRRWRARRATPPRPPSTTSEPGSEAES